MSKETAKHFPLEYLLRFLPLLLALSIAPGQKNTADQKSVEATTPSGRPGQVLTESQLAEIHTVLAELTVRPPKPEITPPPARPFRMYTDTDGSVRLQMLHGDGGCRVAYVLEGETFTDEVRERRWGEGSCSIYTDQANALRFLPEEWSDPSLTNLITGNVSDIGRRIVGAYFLVNDGTGWQDAEAYSILDLILRPPDQK